MTLTDNGVEVIRDWYKEYESLRTANDRLRGQLQNCVNHLEMAKRKTVTGKNNYDAAIESANKALYETLIDV